MMSVQNWVWYNPISWFTSATQPDENELFAKNSTNQIGKFQKMAATAFKDTDDDLQNHSISVSYVYQSTLKDLTLRYAFSNQGLNVPQERSIFKKIILSKPISKEINYGDLDKDIRQKIIDFIQQSKALFPSHLAGIRLIDSDPTKVVFVAQTQFEYLGKPGESLDIAEKLRTFTSLTSTLEKEIDCIINKKPSTLKIPVSHPIRAEELLNRDVETIVESYKVDREEDPMPFASQLDTNLKAVDLLAKQTVFNALFDSLKSNYPQQMLFDMRDEELQFDVSYQLNADKFIGRRESIEKSWASNESIDKTQANINCFYANQMA